MSKFEILRIFVNQRLTAAAEEIFELFERTISEYEEQLEFSSKENQRQQKLLDAVLNPEVRIHRADVQQLFLVKEEVPPEQQEWSLSLDQEDPEPPHMKEEQEELLTSLEGEQLQGLQGVDIKFTFTPVPVKSEECDEEKQQSSHLHQRQTEQIEAESDGEDCGGPEPARNSDPNRPLQPDIREREQLQRLEEADKFPFTSVPVKSVEDDEEKAPFSQFHKIKTKENRVEEHLETEVDGENCGGSEPDRKSDPDSHLIPATQDKTSPYSEPETDDNGHFMETNKPQSGSSPCLTSHARDHSVRKPFSCPFCKSCFSCSNHLDRHMRIHTGEKPFSCSYCGKRFKQKEHLNGHLFGHTGEKPFSCSVCGKRFTYKRDMRRHLAVHTGEKPFSCSVCGKSFAQRQHLKRHLLVHTGEKPFSCSVCDKSFSQLHNAKKHKCVGEISRQM